MWSEALSLFFPRSCTGCERPLLASETYLCTHCLALLPCRKGPKTRDRMMEAEFAGIPRIGVCFSLMPFIKQSMVQNLLHQLKYGGKPRLGQHLGGLLGAALCNEVEADLIIPVPLHKRKEKIRGYNQSSMIARGVAQEIDIPIFEKSLIRTRYSKTQTRMHRWQRQENMKGIFAVNDAEAIKGRKVLLVDDVFTTGATARSIAAILVENEVSEIHVAVLARAE